jgi:hypothetical protein
MVMEEEIERFLAVDDDGLIHTVIVYRRWIDAGTLGNPHRRIVGAKYATLLDGTQLRYVDDDIFFLRETLMLRRVGAKP